MNRVQFFFLFITIIFVNSCISSHKALIHQQRINDKNTIALNDIKITPSRTDNHRVAATKMIDIIDMKLDVSFNWTKHECIGKQLLQIKPYFFETDSIILDAKNMTFNKVEIKDEIGNEILHLINYDKKTLRIHLEKKIKPSETTLLTIHYTAKPDEKETGGSKAIRDDKGLYFINTNNGEPFKPIQIWTQGETEANSCWFPTIDKPNEKFTSTLCITVNKNLTTLSNGIFEGSVEDGNLRTDKWKNPDPMPAYLTMMAIGEFKVTQDSWRGKEVSYYLEPNYHPYARNIFKNTVQMLEFFSNKLGIEYPWNKYAQVVVRDYVSGAMENTSATLHGEFVQKNNRELIDNDNDGIIAHELFHQWFGDLVTCKSWSNLVLNEGFATYGEQLWVEHNEGRDAANKKSWNTIERYLQYSSKNNDGPIVDYNYRDKEDMFNTITYQKGSRVIHLLRQVLGEDAFFLGTRNYLNSFKYDNADIDDLRKEYEKISGHDLRPFFEQWFLQGGHPIIESRYDYIDSLSLLAITIEQKQTADVGLFKFPLLFRVNQGHLSKDYQFNIEKKKEIFYVKRLNESSSEFLNVIIDPEATFIGEIKDNKPFFNQILTYNHAKGFVEKIRALKDLKNYQNQNDTVRVTLLTAINDADEDIRTKALEWIDWKLADNFTKAKDILINMTQNDPSPRVRAKTIEVLNETKNPEFLNLFMHLTNDSSYNIAGTALLAVHTLIPEEALRLCSQLRMDARGKLFQAISTIYATSGTLSDSVFFTQNMPKVFGHQRVALLKAYFNLVHKVGDDMAVKNLLPYLQDKALHDSSPQVQLSAIQLMYHTQQKYENIEKQTKDTELKKLFKESASSVSELVQQTITQITDEKLLSQLKMMGITSDTNP